MAPFGLHKAGLAPGGTFFLQDVLHAITLPQIWQGGAGSAMLWVDFTSCCLDPNPSSPKKLSINPRVHVIFNLFFIWLSIFGSHSNVFRSLQAKQAEADLA